MRLITIISLITELSSTGCSVEQREDVMRRSLNMNSQEWLT